MSKHHYAKDPLLYIHQPHVRTPMARMQSDYRSPKKSAEFQDTHRKYDTRKKVSSQRRPSPKLNQQYPPETSSEKQITDIEGEQAETETKRPKFKDRSLREKIDYFADQPAHIDKMKCEVKTAAKTYRGVITNFDGETVWIRVGKNVREASIPFEQIKQVRMLGL